MNYAVTSSNRIFARHFAEMVLAMFVGMGVLGGLAELSGLADQPTELRVMLMGVYMTLPMAAWMSYRGHSGPRNLEMSASMIVPTVIVAMLASAGTLEIDAAMRIQHGAMIPAMLTVMVWRYQDYARPH
jgi:hypothetical protein